MRDRRSAARALVPVALALLVMLPRLASPQFGLLDDGLTLRTGREVIGRWSSVVHLIPETGRFFPAYWLVYAAVVGVVGARPLAFFALNALLLAGLLALLVQLVRLGGGTARHGFLAAILFAPSGPAIETFYTLSKAEALQMTWIGLSLLATAASAAPGGRARRAGLATLAAALLLLAHATKETSLVLVPVALGWLAIERWSVREPGTGRRFAATYVLANLLAALAFVGVRWHYAPLGLAEGTYTRFYSLDAGALGIGILRMSAWLVRDFAFLLPLLAGVILVLAGGRAPSGRLVRYACVWMGGWLAVYLPWPATFEYYLLPFAFGAAALGGAIAGDLGGGRPRQAAGVSRGAAWAVLVATAALWSPAVVNAVADARVQLVVDRANADLIEFLAGLPTGSRVVVNTARANEYLYQMPLHLTEIKGRPDVVFEHLARAAPEGPTPIFVATPDMANRLMPTVRIPLDEPDVRYVNARLPGVLQERGELVYRGGQEAGLLELGLHRLLCRVGASPRGDATYCPTDRGVIYRRTFWYGWQVHRLGQPLVDPGPRP